MVKNNGLCFVSCCQKRQMVPSMLTDKHVSLSCSFIYKIGKIFLKIFTYILKCSEIKLLKDHFHDSETILFCLHRWTLDLFYNLYWNPVNHTDQHMGYTYSCFKVPKIEKELNHKLNYNQILTINHQDYSCFSFL